MDAIDAVLQGQRDLGTRREEIHQACISLNLDNWQSVCNDLRNCIQEIEGTINSLESQLCEPEVWEGVSEELTSNV